LFTDKELNADDGLDIFLFTEKIEFKSPMQIVVICDCESGHSEFLCRRNKSLRLSEPLKKRIMSMKMKMNKRHKGSFRG